MSVENVRHNMHVNLLLFIDANRRSRGSRVGMRERDVGVLRGRGGVARLQAGWRLASSILDHPIPTVRWVGWLILLLAAFTGPWDRLTAGELYPGPPYPSG